MNNLFEKTISTLCELLNNEDIPYNVRFYYMLQIKRLLEGKMSEKRD